MGNKARYFCVLYSWYHQAWEKRINVLRDTKRPRVLLIESLTSCRLFYCFTGRAPRWKRTFLDTNVSLCFQKRLVQFSNLPKWLNRLYCAWQAALFVVKYSCSNKSNLGFITLMQRCESSNFNSCFFSWWIYYGALRNSSHFPWHSKERLRTPRSQLSILRVSRFCSP